MTRQTVLLVYGGESARHDASVRSARSVYAAMDGDKYETLLGYVDSSGKWWLLERWTDALDEHGGLQLVAALGARGFLVIPGNNLIHPDVVLPLMQDHEENERVIGLAQLLHLPRAGSLPSVSMRSRNLSIVAPALSRHDIFVDDESDEPDASVVVALTGTTKDTETSTSAYIVLSDEPEDSLRSVSDSKLAKQADLVSRQVFETLRCRAYALVTLKQRGNILSVGEVEVYPELSTTGTFVKLWRMSGVHIPEVVDALIAAAKR